MDRRMHSLRVVTLLLLVIGLQVSGEARARDADAVISTGRDEGSYHRIGQRLQRAMAVEYNLWGEVLTSRGSLENLRRLDDPSSPVGVALTQADALSHYLRRHPQFVEQFIVLGDAGKECVFVIAGTAGGFAAATDLKQQTGGEISVDDPESGAAVTFGYLTQLEPRFRATTPVSIETMEALLQLKTAGPRTPLKAAMIVQRPRALSAPIKIALEEPDTYRLVPFTEADVGNARLPDGSVVYTFEQVKVGGLGRYAEIETLCTRGLLLASKEKLSKDVLSRLATLMLESARTIIGSDE
jgi:hypothetical protein